MQQLVAAHLYRKAIKHDECCSILAAASSYECSRLPLLSAMYKELNICCTCSAAKILNGNIYSVLLSMLSAKYKTVQSRQASQS